MADAEVELSALLEVSKNDRLIKIHVGSDGDDERPFLIQQTVLEGVSEYFKNALKHEAVLGRDTEKGVLRFGEDDKFAWNVLVYWMLRGELPDCICRAAPDNQVLFVNCWILGDKYMIPVFQNLAMAELLNIFDLDYIELGAAEVAIRGSTPDSILRRLATEELLKAVFVGKSIRYEELERLDGASSFGCSMVRAVDAARQRQKTHPHMAFGEILQRLGHDAHNQLWKEYMIGSGPYQHWIWEP